MILPLLAQLALGLEAMPPDSPREGQPVDVVPFGEIARWDDAGRDYGVQWEDARDIARVAVEFASADEAPDPGDLRLEYWQSAWPERRIPRDRPSGAGDSGWLDIGDWFQGRWRRADANLERRGAAYTFTFQPVNAKEFPDLGGFSAAYRSTMKLRLVSGAPLPGIASLKAFTDSIWRGLEVAIEWSGRSEEEAVWDGRLEAFNGVVLRVEPLSAASAVEVGTDYSWQSRLRSGTDGIRASLLRARPEGNNSFDEAVFTVRAARETFSFAAADLERWGRIFIPDLGVIVRKSGEETTYARAGAAWRERRDRDIYSRVAESPEQTLTRAWGDMPPRGRHYIPLSFEGSRQHFRLDERGNAACLNHWIARLRGRDTDRCLWSGRRIEYRFGLPGSPLLDRRLVDGCLPMVIGEWEEGGARYRQTAFAAPLAGVPRAAGERILADDPLVLWLRFEVEPSAARPVEARLEFGASHDQGEEKLIHDGGRVLAGGEGPPRLRMLLDSPDDSARYSIEDAGNRLLLRALLTAASPRLTIDAAIPYITLTEEKEWEALRSLRFNAAFRDARDYWRQRIAAGARIRTPEPMIDDFYKAHLTHLLINTEREVGGSDRYMAKVGTFHYGVYSNESCMMVSDLDRRGCHERAAQALETWIHYQGTAGLPGDFSTAAGQFYGAGGYEHGGYNQHHGWVLWCLGEHFWYTRDAAWLDGAAPAMVKGCEWIIGERRRNAEKIAGSRLRAIERGLLPPGRLEDIGDWRSWLSTNVYTWWGMRNAAAALAAGGHPEGERLLGEAEDYRRDLLAAFLEAMRRSPVVRLRDGAWIPHVPSEVHRRGRSFGWITETLEGAIHLVRCEAIDPRDRISTWIIKDYEDNLYLSEQYGYDLKGEEFERHWFSRGGISMQANLLSNPIPYLLRDEPRHFLRAYFNAFAASYFPDTRMMTEHALPEIGSWRGDHFKASDEANSTYWLRLMFIREQGDELWIGQAIPRTWLADGRRIGIEGAATTFGPMSVELESRAARGEIEMRIDPPRRNPPARIRARFRHPDGKRMARCAVNGTPFKEFDPEKEWVILTGWKDPIRLVAYYE